MNKHQKIIVIAVAAAFIIIVIMILANRSGTDQYVKEYQKLEEPKFEGPEPEEVELDTIHSSLYNSTWSLIDHMGATYFGMKYISSGRFASEWEFPDGRRLWLSGNFVAIEEK